MTARIVVIRPDPTTLPPPHGPDHTPCAPCDRMRAAIGHVPLAEYRRQKESGNGA